MKLFTSVSLSAFLLFAPLLSHPQRVVAQAPEAALVPQKGEIRLEGEVRAVNVEGDSFMLLVSSTTNAAGKATPLETPKRKFVHVDEQTQLYVRGAEQSKLVLAQLTPGASVIVIGEAGDERQALQALKVAVWSSENAGKYLYDIPAAPAGALPLAPEVQNSAAAATIAAIRADNTPNEFAFGDFETLKKGIPEGWENWDKRQSKIITDDKGNHFLKMEAKSGFWTLDSVIPVPTTWKRIRASARMRVRNLILSDQSWARPHIDLIWQDANNKIIEYGSPPVLATDSDWTIVSSDATVPTGSKTLRISARLLGVARGEMSIDDIRITANPTPLGLPIKEGFPEGSFEKFNPDSTPLTWKLIDPRTMKIVEENGNHFLRLINASSTFAVTMNTWFSLDPAWDALKISVRMRAKDMKPGAKSWENGRLSLEFQNRQGEHVGDWLEVPHLTQDSDWDTKTATYTIPDGAEFLKMQPAIITATGIVDFDDIQVEPVSLATQPGTNPSVRALPIRENELEGTFDGEGGKVAGWTLSKGATLVTENDNRFLHLQNDDTETTVGAEARFRIPPGWQSVRIRLKMRAKNLDIGHNPLDTARLEWNFEDAGHTRIGNMPPGPSLQEDTDWKTEETLAAVPPGATVIRINPKLSKTLGSLDVDDLSIEEVKD